MAYGDFVRGLSVFSEGDMKWGFWIFTAVFLALPGAPAHAAETVKSYAQQCDAAIGLSVPAFDCNAGREVPLTHPMPPNAKYGDKKFSCDEPNRLNEECDPGSRFQVVAQTATAVVVAHCRNQGGNPNRYGDIAVIQHNTQNGATCFYQALAGAASVGHPRSAYSEAQELPALAPAPINGSALPQFWLQPWQIAKSVFACAMCHDSGPFIRSPYLAQMNSGTNALPWATDTSFNAKGKPYAFPGKTFAKWKAYSVEVKDNMCIGCHRLGVSNISDGKSGTGIYFSLKATSPSQKGDVPGQLPEENKNPYTDDGDPATMESHIWMPPNSVHYDPAARAAAKAISTCAKKFKKVPLPNTDTCRITLFAHSF
jgi:hypothetical protein